MSASDWGDTIPNSCACTGGGLYGGYGSSDCKARPQVCSHKILLVLNGDDYQIIGFGKFVKLLDRAPPRKEKWFQMLPDILTLVSSLVVRYIL